jgi:hypothetical protein
VHVGHRADLGYHDGGRAGLGGGGDVGRVPLGVEPVHPDGDLLGAVVTRRGRRAHPLAGFGLGVGSHGVLEVEDQGIGVDALGLLERPLVGIGPGM